MAHITIVADKKYKVTYEVKTLDGSRKRKSKTFKEGTKLKDVKAFMRKVETEYERSEGVDYSQRTFSEFIDEYFELFSHRLSPSTQQRYKRMANSQKNGIKQFFGTEIQLKDLRTRDVQEYANWLEESQGLQPKTIKNYIMLIHTIYDKAMRLRYVSLEYNIVSNVELPKVRKKKVDAYTDEEIRELLKRVDQEPNYLFRLQIYLAIGTGCRRSELAALRYDDVDFEKKEIHITKARVTADNGDAEKEPKTQSGFRDIPISDTLVKMLKDAKRIYLQNKLKYGATFQDSGYIFSNEDGSVQRVNEQSIRWSRFMKKNPDLRYLPLHSAGRHSCASLLISQGVSAKTVQTILGHADISTTLNVYTSSYKTDEVEGMKKLESLIFAKEA